MGVKTLEHLSFAQKKANLLHKKLKGINSEQPDMSKVEKSVLKRIMVVAVEKKFMGNPESFVLFGLFFLL